MRVGMEGGWRGSRGIREAIGMEGGDESEGRAEREKGAHGENHLRHIFMQWLFLTAACEVCSYRCYSDKVN